MDATCCVKWQRASGRDGVTCLFDARRVPARNSWKALTLACLRRLCALGEMSKWAAHPRRADRVGPSKSGSPLPGTFMGESRREGASPARGRESGGGLLHAPRDRSGSVKGSPPPIGPPSHAWRGRRGGETRCAGAPGGSGGSSRRGRSDPTASPRTSGRLYGAACPTLAPRSPEPRMLSCRRVRKARR